MMPGASLELSLPARPSYRGASKAGATLTLCVQGKCCLSLWWFLFWGRILLGRLGWLWICHFSASASPTLGLWHVALCLTHFRFRKGKISPFEMWCHYFCRKFVLLVENSRRVVLPFQRATGWTYVNNMYRKVSFFLFSFLIFVSSLKAT